MKWGLLFFLIIGAFVLGVESYLIYDEIGKSQSYLVENHKLRDASNVRANNNYWNDKNSETIKLNKDLSDTLVDNDFLKNQVIKDTKEMGDALISIADLQSKCSVGNKPEAQKCAENFPGSYKGYNEAFNTPHDYEILSSRMKGWTKIKGTEESKNRLACETLYQRQIWNLGSKGRTHEYN